MSSEKVTGMKWTEMTFCEKVRNVLENVSVEPMVFFHIVPIVFAGLATQNLNLEKACRVNLKYSDEVCTALRSRQTEDFKVEEKNVQKMVASMSVWTTPLRSSIPALLVMFLGSWSDRKKRRKPFMLIPIVGEFMACVGLLVCVYYFYELPMEVAGFVESFFPAITGGWITMFMAVFSYMGDRTSEEMRTVRIGVLNLCGSVGIPLGTALSGVALQAIGFYGIFSLSAIMFMLSITYGIFRIKETPLMTDVKQPGNIEKHNETATNNSYRKDRFSLVRFLKEFFDLTHIKETFSVVFKRAAHNRRQRIIFLIAAQTLIMIAAHGKWRKQHLLNFYLIMLS